MILERENSLNNISCANCDGNKNFLIKNLDKTNLHCLDKHKSEIQLKAKNIIYSEGAFANAAFCINSGSLKLYSISGNGRSHIVKIVGKGDIIGFNELLTNSPYFLTAETLEDVYACRINKNNFFEILETNKSLKDYLIHQISFENRGLINDVILISNQSVFQKLAYILLMLNDFYKNEGINLTRQDLADFVGASKENIIRELSYLKKQKIISIQNRLIHVKNFPALKHIISK